MRGRAILWLFRIVRASPFGITLATLCFFLTQNPLAHPFVDRSIDSARLVLQRAMAREVTPGWVRAEMEQALAAEDFERVTTLAYIAADQGIAPGPKMVAQINALEARVTGTWATARDCARCIADITVCPSLTLMASCALPVELSPVGDLNALRRAGVDAVKGDEVDKIEVSLAVVGLGATAAVVVSGGTSATVKAGSTLLRLGRKLGTLSPAFLRSLRQMSNIEVNPAQISAYSRGKVPLEAVLDTARLSQLTAVSADLTRVVRNTSLPDALDLLRHVDSAEDAARLARVSEVAGPETRASFLVLGKARVFRAVVRLSDIFIATSLLIFLTVLQVGVLLAQLISGRVFRRLTAPKARSGLW